MSIRGLEERARVLDAGKHEMESIVQQGRCVQRENHVRIALRKTEG